MARGPRSPRRWDTAHTQPGSPLPNPRRRQGCRASGCGALGHGGGGGGHLGTHKLSPVPLRATCMHPYVAFR